MSQKGFSLIGLVGSIIILGVSSVIAAPKFLNLKNDALFAIIGADGAAIKSALELVHMKAEIGPIVDDMLQLSGGFVSISPESMYPDFSETNSEKQIKEKINVFVDIDLSRYDAMVVNDGFVLYPNAFRANKDEFCVIDYVPNREPEKLHVITTGCF